MLSSIRREYATATNILSYYPGLHKVYIVHSGVVQLLHRNNAIHQLPSNMILHETNVKWSVWEK